MTDTTGFTINRGSGGTFTLHQDSGGGSPVFASTSGVPIPDPALAGGYQMRGVYVCGDPLTYIGDAYLQRGGVLTGVAASPFGSASFWVNLFQLAGTGVFPWTGNTSSNWFDIDQEFGINEVNGSPNTNQPYAYLDTYNVADPLLETRGPLGSCGDSGSPPSIPPGKWYHVLLSWDTNHASGARVFQCYVNDVAKTMTPLQDIGIAFSTNYPAFVDNFGINQPSGLFPMGDTWFAPGHFIDLTVTANRRKFIDGTGSPVFLGDDGSIPLGVAPAMFFTVPPFVSVVPEVKIAKTPDEYNVVLIDGNYQIRRTEKRVYVNAGAACTLRLPQDIGVQPMPAGLGQGPVFDTVIRIKDVSGAAGTNNITIVDPRSLLIDGAASYVFNTNYASKDFSWNGTGWSVHPV